ncbi:MULTISPECIES: hypothetical protein [Bacillaceae]|uniref:HEPN domain-containing protein n=1 Tax=Evansella alkalicola TaxID=745819 RepID=A0ABS6JY50_9BACI|nr:MULTISPECIES: hypothetical protein [Bacillaceae]MBU9723157.1 hypothetical protein [Bacillus alkalicola]
MFDWSNNLKVAKELTEKEEEEYHRTAISRAYYSAFGNARKYLDDNSFPYDNNDGSLHKKVWTSYSFISNEIYINGDRLRKQRVDADYKQKLNNFKNKSKRAIDLADLVNQKVKEL